VADRLFVDLAADGRVSVGTWLEGELPGGAEGEQDRLGWPLDADALEELRWYLEDYLQAPFGVYEDRGPGVAARLASWGQAVFGAVFGLGPARDAYQRMRARPAGVQVVFRSGSASLLGLPWELMRDPDRSLPLVLDAGVAGIDRSLPTAELDASFEVAGGDRLRVLMVISRPAGAADVGYRMIARPLLERLEAVRGAVDLVVLRPPTLDALAQTLAEAAAAGEPFQVMHFDGHGVLAGRRAGAPGMYQDAAPEGVLVFQAADGGRDPVSASRVAQVLAAARVPVVVLNACQSGAVGKQLEAAVATRLLQGGAASVVAMAYSVYAVAAAEFMAAFYERLFAGDTVSAAVTAGRQRLFRHPGRPSPKGDLPLADWVVPVHYLRREVRFPDLVTARPAEAPSLEEALDQLAGPGPGGDGGALAPVGVFTGRDGLFYELETAARLQKVVILQGPAGTGKTELAKAFGRWWQDTGGVERPEWVFWHSFEPGLASFGLDGVITELGLAVYGPDFARLDTDKRTGVVEGFLWDRRALLIWDNFESVRSVPDPAAATPPLDEAGCQQLRGFLRKLAAGGRSTVLVTSRAEESWLDDGAAHGPGGAAVPVTLRRIRVAGLSPEEATQYAGDLLTAYPAAALRRADQAFGQLMQWLDGHPLSMRLVLPHLDTTGPGVLLAGLRGTAPLPGWEDGSGGRLTSLPASLGYSYAHLEPAHQRLLAAVCLFHDTADVSVLGAFSAMDNVPQRFQGVSEEGWGEVLDAAAGAGLLTRLGGGLYRLHPALPAYLAARWRTDEDAGYDDQRAAATRTLLSACAAFGGWLQQQITSGDAGLAYTIIGLQQRTMSHLLGYALDSQSWAEALEIAAPLSRYWRGRGLYAEAGAWTDRVRLATEDADGTPPGLDSVPGRLWLFFAAEQAQRQMGSGRLDAAERTYREILTMLEANPTPPQQGNLAVMYHQLGMVAQARGRLDEAADWYARSLAICEELGDRPKMANNYHQLGTVSQARGRLDEAADWYARSLAIKEELGDRPKMANSYHQLGRVAQARGRLDEAADWYARSLALDEELGDRPGTAASYHQLGTVTYLRRRLDEAADWYTRSLAISEELGDRPKMANSYHQLGIVAQARGRLDEAADWYTRSLAISEELGDRPKMASSYHQLGNIAYLQGRLNDAADWYARSLALDEELGDRPGTALSYGQLGLLAEARDNPGQALEWMVRCVALFDDFPHPSTGPGPGHLARLTRQLGIPALEACWQKVTGCPLPSAVRDYAHSYRPDTGDAPEGADR
jgi:tetratricopeptide (TPR) repeat protein